MFVFGSEEVRGADNFYVDAATMNAKSEQCPSLQPTTQISTTKWLYFQRWPIAFRDSDRNVGLLQMP